MLCELRKGSVGFACLLLTCVTATAQAVPSNGQMSVEELAARVSAMNEARRVALKSYESRRVMTVEYQGPLGDGKAAETVLMTFKAPDSKQFVVLSSTGAQVIRESVFQRALTAEQAAAKLSAQRASALNLENYTMRLVGRETLASGSTYVLEVAPKTASTFTYVGKVWVQAADFAVVRIQGKPAVNPSPWTSDGEFTTDFQKVGQFYVPQRTVSTSSLPFGVRASLTIQYEAYRILDAASVGLPLR